MRYRPQSKGKAMAKYNGNGDTKIKARPTVLLTARLTARLAARLTPMPS